MNIYVDFDDCLCETARSFSDIVRDEFGIDVPYENMRYFNLQKAFDLNDEQYDWLLTRGHEPDVLLSYEETPGAAQTLNEWMRMGYNVSIITGRPFNSYDASREWLDRHGLKDADMFCLNKYGRDGKIYGNSFSLELEDYYKMKFDFAVEDSPSAFKFFGHLPELKVMVFDRPWNRDTDFPNGNYERYSDWESIRSKIASYAS